MFPTRLEGIEIEVERRRKVVLQEFPTRLEGIEMCCFFAKY